MKFRLLTLLLLGLLASPATAHMPSDGSQQSIEPHAPADGSNAASWCAAHMRRGELVQAYFDCEQAVRDDPSDARALSNRGSLFLLTHAPARAKADFDAALNIESSDPTLFFNRGLAYSRLGQSASAIADYTEAIRINPKLAIAYHNRAREHELLGSRENAIRDYNAALKADPSLRPSQQELERLGTE